MYFGLNTDYHAFDLKLVNSESNLNLPSRIPELSLATPAPEPTDTDESFPF